MSSIGGFKIHPQILWWSSLQEVRINCPPLECGLELLLMDQLWEKECVTSATRIQNSPCSSFLGTFGSLALRKASLHVLKTSKQPYEWVPWHKTKAHCQLQQGIDASCQQPCERAILEMDPTATAKPSNAHGSDLAWLQPYERPWARTTQQTTSEFLTQRNSKIIKVCAFGC